MEFHFQGHLRLSAGWSNPNAAALYFGSLVLLFWLSAPVDEGARPPGLLLRLIGEAAGVLATVETYSRTAVAGLVSVAMLSLASGRRTPRPRSIIWILRLSAVVEAALGIGFVPRVSPDYLRNDASVLHRIEVWGKIPQMMAAEPSGWGAGEAGPVFRNWYQPAGDQTRYIDVLSDLFDLGVERGLWTLWPIVTCVVLAVHRLGSRQPEDRSTGNRTRLGAGLVLFSFFCSSANRLFPDPVLWLPAATGVCLLVFPHPRCLREEAILATARSAAAAGALLSAMLLVGRIQRLAQGYSIGKLDARGEVLLFRRPNADVRRCAILADPEVLGDPWGTAIREGFESVLEPGFQLAVFDPRFPTAADNAFKGDALVLVTGAVGRYPNRSAATVIVNPSEEPPIGLTGVRRVILGGLDELGLNTTWTTWARRRKIRVDVVPGVGQDLRSVWPTLFQQVVNQRHLVFGS